MNKKLIVITITFFVVLTFSLIFSTYMLVGKPGPMCDWEQNPPCKYEPGETIRVIDDDWVQLENCAIYPRYAKSDSREVVYPKSNK